MKHLISKKIQKLFKRKKQYKPTETALGMRMVGKKALKVRKREYVPGR